MSLQRIYGMGGELPSLDATHANEGLYRGLDLAGAETVVR